MATSQPALAAARGLVAVRASLLNSDGSRNCGVTDGSAYSLCVQSIAQSTQTEAGNTETINCGTGTVFATVTTDDTDTGVELTMEFTSWDLEFISLITGAEVLYSAGDVIGLAKRAANQTAPRFELHAWTEMRASSALAGSLPYMHHVWGNCTAQVGDFSLGEGFTTISVTVNASGVSGSTLGNGSHLDIPVEAFDGASDGGFSAFWRVAASDVPDADTAPYNNGLGGGFYATPACSS